MTPSSKLHIVKPHPDAVTALRHRAPGGAKLAPGFKANKGLNLSNRGGRTLGKVCETSGQARLARVLTVGEDIGHDAIELRL